MNYNQRSFGTVEDGCPGAWIFVSQEGQSYCASSCPPPNEQHVGPNGEKICTNIVSNLTPTTPGGTCPGQWLYVSEDGQSYCVDSCPSPNEKHVGPSGEKICTDILSQSSQYSQSQSSLHPNTNKSQVPPTAYASVSLPQMFKEPAFWLIAALFATASYIYTKDTE